MKTFTVEIADPNNAVMDLHALFKRLVSEGINLNAVAGALLIIKSYSLKIPQFYQLSAILCSHMHINAVFGTEWFSDESMGTKVDIRLILTGIAILK